MVILVLQTGTSTTDTPGTDVMVTLWITDCWPFVRALLQRSPVQATIPRTLNGTLQNSTRNITDSCILSFTELRQLHYFGNYSYVLWIWFFSISMLTERILLWYFTDLNSGSIPAITALWHLLFGNFQALSLLYCGNRY